MIGVVIVISDVLKKNCFNTLFNNLGYNTGACSGLNISTNNACSISNILPQPCALQTAQGLGWAGEAFLYV
jgi:hypothetical protein